MLNMKFFFFFLKITLIYGLSVKCMPTWNMIYKTVGLDKVKSATIPFGSSITCETFSIVNILFLVVTFRQIPILQALVISTEENHFFLHTGLVGVTAFFPSKRKRWT